MTQGLIERIEDLGIFVGKIMDQKGDQIGRFILENYIYFSINGILESFFRFHSHSGIKVNGYSLLVDNYDTHVMSYHGKVNITGTLVGCITYKADGEYVALPLVRLAHFRILEEDFDINQRIPQRLRN